MRPRSVTTPTMRRRFFSALAAGALLAVMVASIVAGESAALRAEAVYSTALAQYRASEQALLTRVTTLESAAQSLAAPLVVARDLLESSAGHVLDEVIREELAAAISTADAAVAEVATSAAEGRRLLAESADGDTDGGTNSGADSRTDGSTAGSTVGGERTPNDLTRSHEALSAAANADPSSLAAARAAVRAQVEATTNAVAAWQAEQDRLAAEAAVREAAAAAAAAAEAEAVKRAQAATVASPSRSGSSAAAPAASGGPGGGTPAASAAAPAPAPAPAPPPPPAPARHNEHVWATGFQAELDACKGSVNMTPSFGTGVIGEHWSCGGSSFPRTEGAIVVLSGVMSGTFRVGPVVAVLNQRVDRIEDVPQGYELLYQTCLDGDNTRMSFTQLIRVS